MNGTLDTGPLKEFLAEAVAYIIDTRMNMNRPPYMATESNIKNVLAQNLGKALAELVKDGTFTERQLLNEKAYEFTPPKQTNLNLKRQ